MRRRRALTVSMTILMMLCVSFVVPAPSLAASVTNKQTVPGLTQRTIWDTSQVLCYRLPDGINHAGYIHMELTFRPAWADFDLYLLDESGQALSQEMGSMAAFVGREAVDFNVTSVRDQTIEPAVSYGADDVRMVGDTYYVVVVAFNEAARCRVAGYYPQIDLAVSADTTATDNYYLKSFRRPADTGAWVTLDGPEYGYPYDFTPTSTGQGEVRLEWPANVQTRSVTYDRQHAPSPANMESYLYAGSSWETVFQDFGESNWTPPDQGGWYGLRDTFLVEDGGRLAQPLRMLHWVPSLFLKASDETLGPLAPPQRGKSTVGFKGTLLYPENLRLASAPRSVRKGGRATVKGTLARGGIGLPTPGSRSR